MVIYSSASSGYDFTGSGFGRYGRRAGCRPFPQALTARNRNCRPSDRRTFGDRSSPFGTDSANLWTVADDSGVLRAQARVVHHFGCELCAIARPSNRALVCFGAGLERDFVRRTEKPLASQAKQQCPLDRHCASLPLAGSPTRRASPSPMRRAPSSRPGLQNILHSTRQSTPNLDQFR
jgi:hypothetical protein